MIELKRAAVLGSNSFSGAHYVDLLLERGFEVVGISRSAEYLDCMLPYKRHKGARFSFHQLNLNTQLPEIMAVLDRFRPAYVANFAAQGEVGSSFAFPSDYFRTNALGMVAFVEQLRTRKDYLERYLHISTPEVYGTIDAATAENNCVNPSSPYAASKAAADLFNFVLFKTYRFPVVTIRAANVYGPSQQLYRVVPRTVIAAKTGGRLKLQGGGVARKSYMHIRDVSEGEFAAMLRGRPGEVYHLSPSAGPIAIRDLVALVCRHMGVRFSDIVDIVEDRPGQDAAYFINSLKAQSELGWRPCIALEDGIDGVLAWFDRNWPVVSQLSTEYRHLP